MKNEFVAYLNTLHSGNANNKGALAEAQAKEPLFAELQVSHPWASEIFTKLTSASGGNVILSGHAGDGKSTIAIEALRMLHRISENQLLPNGLMRIETLDFDGRQIKVIKDLSECTVEERRTFFDEMIAGSCRYLLISNTGTLLDFFLSRKADLKLSAVEIENRVLTALDAPVCQPLDFSALQFSVYNLAQCNNVDLGLKLLGRMLESRHWDACQACPYAKGCPIYANRSVMNEFRTRILSRIGLIYERAYAYGERLTMRQVSAHFAYLLTAGLDCSRVERLAVESALKPDGKYSFINRFWGDDGSVQDPRSLQMKAIRTFASQPLNETFAPSIERRFWTDLDAETFDLGVPALAVEAKGLLKRSRRTGVDQLVAAVCARRNWRRYVYFLYEPGVTEATERQEFDQFLAAFLGSQMTLHVHTWQCQEPAFKKQEGKLTQAVFSVLQEEFCGYLPAEGQLDGKKLYITLRQKNTTIVQSAQLILCQIDYSDAFTVKLRGLPKKLPTLIGVDDFEGIQLVLDIPFLDYVLARRAGSTGRGISASYRDRLEKLRNEIISRKRSKVTGTLQILERSEDGKLSVLKVRVAEEDSELEVL